MNNDTANLSLDEVGERAEAFYDSVLRSQVETPENIGKYLMLDTLTGRVRLRYGSPRACPNACGDHA